MSAGAIAGIVVGCVVFVSFVAVGVVFLVRSRVNKNDIRSESVCNDNKDTNVYAFDTTGSHPNINSDPFLNDEA